MTTPSGRGKRSLPLSLLGHVDHAGGRKAFGDQATPTRGTAQTPGTR